MSNGALADELRDECAQLSEENDNLRARVAELEGELRVAKGFHDVAVKERDLERHRVAELEARITQACALIEDTRRLARTGRPMPSLATILDMYWTTLRGDSDGGKETD